MTPQYSGSTTTTFSGGNLMDDFSDEYSGALPSTWTARSGAFSNNQPTGQLSVGTHDSYGGALAYYNGGGTVTNYGNQCAYPQIGTLCRSTYRAPQPH